MNKVVIDLDKWTTVVKKAAKMKCSRQYVWAQMGRGKLRVLYIPEIDLTLVEK